MQLHSYDTSTPRDSSLPSRECWHNPLLGCITRIFTDWITDKQDYHQPLPVTWKGPLACLLPAFHVLGTKKFQITTKSHKLVRVTCSPECLSVWWPAGSYQTYVPSYAGQLTCFEVNYLETPSPSVRANVDRLKWTPGESQPIIKSLCDRLKWTSRKASIKPAGCDCKLP